MVHRILIVEDDAVLADGMSRVLRDSGYSVLCLSDGVHAHDALLAEPFDLVILDLGLPRMDGLALLRRLRAKDHAIAVLIVTAHNAVSERVNGLKAGADDYLTKPFDLTEFEERVHALIRRSQKNITTRLKFGTLAMDTTSRRTTVNNEPVDLGPREYSILEALMANADRVVSRADLNQLVALGEEELSDNIFQVNISRLRKKIDGSGVTIRTVRGFGYMLQKSLISAGRR